MSMSATTRHPGPAKDVSVALALGRRRHRINMLVKMLLRDARR